MVSRTQEMLFATNERSEKGVEPARQNKGVREREKPFEDFQSRAKLVRGSLKFTQNWKDISWLCRVKWGQKTSSFILAPTKSALVAWRVRVDQEQQERSIDRSIDFSL